MELLRVGLLSGVESGKLWGVGLSFVDEDGRVHSFCSDGKWRENTSDLDVSDGSQCLVVFT